MMSAWEMNARHAEHNYGVQVDWEERFYICPECGEPVYECDWTDDDMYNYLCPICEYDDDEEDK